jgi:hypothetical protein
VGAARRRSTTWAEIATRLGVTRQSAWERWGDLDEELASKPADRASEPAVSVPDVIGLGWETARRVLLSAQLAAVNADPDAPPPVTGIDGTVVLDQKPAPGERVRPGSTVMLWLGHGPGSGGVREPLHPRPSPRSTGGAVDEETGESVP